jgi:tRNA (guanine-N7-)-methyltransferase
MISDSELKKTPDKFYQVGKNKLARWNELAGFSMVIQTEAEAVAGTDHPVKGTWNRAIFRNNNPIVLELGCGKGEYTTGLAARFPDRNFIGIDIKGARMWRGAKTASEANMGNVAFLRTRIEFVSSFFAEDEVDEIWITFPDPHPGPKNSTKRLTSSQFLNRYRLFLKDAGKVHLKTDNKDLYTYSKKVAGHNELEILHATDDLYSGSFQDDILAIKTYYEKKFLEAGLKINYLSFRLTKNRNLEDAPYRRTEK